MATSDIRTQVETLLLAGRTPRQIVMEDLIEVDALDLYGLKDCDDEDVVVLPGWVADDGQYDVEYPEAESGEEAAREYVVGGDWGQGDGGTVWVTVHVWRTSLRAVDGEVVEERVDEDSHKIEVEPSEPECSHDDGHDWQRPHSIVGGIEENPGVWGHGGGVTITECCMHCGCRRTTDTWAQDPADGQQGLDSVTYEAGAFADDVAALRVAP